MLRSFTRIYRRGRTRKGQLDVLQQYWVNQRLCPDGQAVPLALRY